jgi:hypothetical protein
MSHRCQASRVFFFFEDSSFIHKPERHLDSVPPAGHHVTCEVLPKEIKKKSESGHAFMLLLSTQKNKESMFSYITWCLHLNLFCWSFNTKIVKGQKEGKKR